MKTIFFDGHCPMCHSWVKRIIRWDKHKKFTFSPLEGQLAKEKLPPLLPGYLEADTIILFDHGKVSLRSEAAMNIFRQLPFPIFLLGIGRIVPVKLRDAVYRWVASRRYRFGDRYDVCPLPPKEWQDRFI